MLCLARRSLCLSQHALKACVCRLPELHTSLLRPLPLLCLQLDAGSNEEVLLMSRDEQVMLVVTYADIKVSRCVHTHALLVAAQLMHVAVGCRPATAPP
jgi:hypothetical protein